MESVSWLKDSDGNMLKERRGDEFLPLCYIRAGHTSWLVFRVESLRDAGTRRLVERLVPRASMSFDPSGGHVPGLATEVAVPPHLRETPHAHSRLSNPVPNAWTRLSRSGKPVDGLRLLPVLPPSVGIPLSWARTRCAAISSALKH